MPFRSNDVPGLRQRGRFGLLKPTRGARWEAKVLSTRYSSENLVQESPNTEQNSSFSMIYPDCPTWEMQVLYSRYPTSSTVQEFPTIEQQAAFEMTYPRS